MTGPNLIPRAFSPVHDDFWISSGHHLVDRAENGGLLVTDAFLAAYLARPELIPPPEACPVERGLHAALLAEPRRKVGSEELSLIADSDARENFDFFLAYRDKLLGHPTIEAAYLAMMERGFACIPPLFVQQLTHLIARNAFDGVEDGMVLRAAECFFRPQRVTFHDGRVLLADADLIETHETDRHNSPLLSMLGGPAVTQIEVMTAVNAGAYRARSDAHDLVFDLTTLDPGRMALAKALSIWIGHLTGITLDFKPVERLADEKVGWFLALDSEGTMLGNAVWQGDALDAEAQSRILALFTFTLPDDARIEAAQRGASGFAVLGMSEDRLVRIKPQNLIGGLPLLRKS